MRLRTLSREQETPGPKLELRADPRHAGTGVLHTRHSESRSRGHRLLQPQEVAEVFLRFSPLFAAVCGAEQVENGTSQHTFGAQLL